MKLTEHFTRKEMEVSAKATELGLDNTCPDIYYDNMVRVAKQLELIREHFNAPVTVLSCYRSTKVNRAVGGSLTSAHRQGLAADFRVKGVPVVDVCRWAAMNIDDYDQIIYEFGPDGWCHMGFTNNIARGQLLTATKRAGKTVYALGIFA